MGAGIKNDMEAAVYSSRDKLEREDIVAVTTEEQRAELSKLATDLEDWMYETGSTKSDYEQRLAALQGLLGPMEERALEMEHRSSLADTVKEAIRDMEKARKHIAKNMSWVHANKTEAALKKQTEFQEWWAKKSEQQSKLPLHEAPAFTVKEVQEKISKIEKEWDKLKKMKKPKEPTQAEITTLREKKAAAVEKEDFDLAHSLKAREQALAKHLEKLKEAKSEL